MRNALLAVVLMAGCAFEPTAEPENHFRALSWAEVESVLPRPTGSRELARQQSPEVLGAVLCFEGEGAGAKRESELRGGGWTLVHQEEIGPSRIDVTATHGALVLTGSLTAQPMDGCAQGFVYGVRKEVAP